MKKYNLYLWLAALVGLFASCSQDENAMLQTNESNRVSLTAELPDDFAQIGTRSVPNAPDDNHTLRCILEVWTTDQSPVLKHRQEQINLSGDHVEFNFTIDAGTYDCLFWADFIAKSPSTNEATIGSVTYTHYDDKYYKTDDTKNGLKAISIITENYAFNTDARDAFFGKYKLEKGAAAIENQPVPSLTRPFAKLTIKEKNATNYNDCSGLTAEYNVPKTFNVSTAGVVAGSTVKVTCSSKSSESPILFSDYIFTDVNSNLGEVTLNFSSASDRTFQTATIPAGIPLQRNFKTNASGSLITEKPAPTDGVKMTVTMNADWDGNVEEDATQWDGKSTAEPTSYTGNSKDIVNITSAAELAWLAKECNDGNTFKDYTFNLTTDIDLNNHEWTPIGNVENRFKGNFNGQGHTVRNMEVNGATAAAGFIGYMEGEDGKLLKVSNLIVEGNVNAVSTGGMAHAGGICGYTSFVKIEFCRFNGTVSGAGDIATECGGIVGSHGGGSDNSLTCCISDAKVTVSDQSGSDCGGGLVGKLRNGPVTYSAWNSSGIAKGVGEITHGDFADTNKSFTTIAELNELLGNMNNNSKPDSEYKWQAGTGTDAYPILVLNDNN